MKVYLREIELDDGPQIVRWRNSPLVAAHCLNKTPITIESNELFYQTNIITGIYKQYIVERIDDDYNVASYPIATVYLKDIDRINHRCQLCIFTSDDQEWNTESQSIAISMLLDKAFREFEMHKVYSYVFAEFPEEVDLLKKAGFRVEAILESEACNMEGHYSDVIRMCIIRQ